MLRGSLHSGGESLGRKTNSGSWKGEPLEGRGVERGGGPSRRSTSDWSPGTALAFTVVRGTNPDRQWVHLRWQLIHPFICSSILHSSTSSVNQSVTKPVLSRTLWDYADKLGPCCPPDAPCNPGVGPPLGHLLHQSMCLMPALTAHPAVTHKAFRGPFHCPAIPSLRPSVPTARSTSPMYSFSRVLWFVLLTPGATGALGP